MSDSFLAAVDARSAEVSSAVSSSAGPHVWLLSDVHAEYKENFAWIRGLAEQDRFKDDVLILAGDIAADLDIIREVFEVMLSGFAAVFFAPGNHDLWTKAKPATPRMPAFNRQHWSETNPASRPASPARQSSLDKLSEIAALCEELGVHMQPAYAGGAIVAPILSWYHASWDTEPDVVGWDGIPPHDLVMRDFHMCFWPPPLRTSDESVARRLDAMNDERQEGGVPLAARVQQLRAEHPHAPLITVSHFVPHMELNPEKRYLYYPPLAKAMGSVFLRTRVQALHPTVHCFGHTHFGWDMTLDDGIRYIQAPLSYPEERLGRLGSVATGETFPHGEPPTPLLVYDGGTRSFPPQYDAGWSNFYHRYPRRPDLNHIIAPYVAAGGSYSRIPGVGEIGWFGNAHDPFGQPLPEPLPAWKLGPRSAVEFEEAARAADADHYRQGGGESSPGSLRRAAAKPAVPRGSSPLSVSELIIRLELLMIGLERAILEEKGTDKVREREDDDERNEARAEDCFVRAPLLLELLPEHPHPRVLKKRATEFNTGDDGATSTATTAAAASSAAPAAASSSGSSTWNGAADLEEDIEEERETKKARTDDGAPAAETKAPPVDPNRDEPALKRWEVRVLAQIDLHTDDSFQFNKAAKVVREMAWVRDAQSV